MHKPRFVRWETPFTDVQWPSAVILVQPAGLAEPNPVSALVAPDGVNKYPKYFVHFGDVVAFTCMEEMHFPERDFGEAECEAEGLSAYEYLDSTWLKSYTAGEYFLFNIDGGSSERLRHFLIVGGDNYIEVITRHNPVIEEVSFATSMKLVFNI